MTAAFKLALEYIKQIFVFLITLKCEEYIVFAVGNEVSTFDEGGHVDVHAGRNLNNDVLSIGCTSELRKLFEQLLAESWLQNKVYWEEFRPVNKDMLLAKLVFIVDQSVLSVKFELSDDRNRLRAVMRFRIRPFWLRHRHAVDGDHFCCVLLRVKFPLRLVERLNVQIFGNWL